VARGLDVTRWRALLLSIAFGCAVLGSSGGCLAPTLPIPPPSVSSLEGPDADGFVTISGTAGADAYVFVLNESTDSGVIGRATPTGSYSIRVQASSGDELTLWQMQGSETGQLVMRTVP
jgi:hypothetical protein